MAYSLPGWICRTCPSLSLSTNLYWYEKLGWCYTWGIQLCLQLLNITLTRCFVSAGNVFTTDGFFLFYITSAQETHCSADTPALLLLHHRPHRHPAPPVYVPLGCQLHLCTLGTLNLCIPVLPTCLQRRNHHCISCY